MKKINTTSAEKGNYPPSLLKNLEKSMEFIDTLDDLRKKLIEDMELISDVIAEGGVVDVSNFAILQMVKSTNKLQRRFEDDPKKVLKVLKSIQTETNRIKNSRD